MMNGNMHIVDMLSLRRVVFSREQDEHDETVAGVYIPLPCGACLVLSEADIVRGYQAGREYRQQLISQIQERYDVGVSFSEGHQHGKL